MVWTEFSTICSAAAVISFFIVSMSSADISAVSAAVCAVSIAACAVSLAVVACSAASVASERAWRACSIIEAASP